jgi:hypothetical protein
MFGHPRFLLVAKGCPFERLRVSPVKARGDMDSEMVTTVKRDSWCILLLGPWVSLHGPLLKPRGHVLLDVICANLRKRRCMAMGVKRLWRPCLSLATKTRKDCSIMTVGGILWRLLWHCIIPYPQSPTHCIVVYVCIQNQCSMVGREKVAISRTQRNILRYSSSGIADTGIVLDTRAICHDSPWHVPLSRDVPPR